MAEKRMFTQKIVDSDAFLDMPLSAQALYFHLAMRADDDGFVNNPKKITRYIGSADDDLKLLLAKRFIIGFDSGVIVIKHWRMHNAIKKDRYHPTDYREEYARLETKQNGAYTERGLSPAEAPALPSGTQMEPEWNTNGTQMEPEIRLDKIRLGLEESTTTQMNNSSTHQEGLKQVRESRRFSAPTLEQVAAYCAERSNGIDPEAFVDFYARQGWKLSNGRPMVDWKAAVRTWEKRRSEDRRGRQESTVDRLRRMKQEGRFDDP